MDSARGQRFALFGGGGDAADEPGIAAGGFAGAVQALQIRRTKFEASNLNPRGRKKPPDIPGVLSRSVTEFHS